MSYQQKYLKYKRKQLNLNNQFGGELCPVCGLEIVDGSCQCQGVKVSYFPSISGSYEELGLTPEEFTGVNIAQGGQVRMFNFDPEPLIEGVHFSYATNPPTWMGPYNGDLARSTFADLLTKITITFAPTGRYIGEIKPGTMFELFQYNSKKTQRMVKRNIAGFIGPNISR